MTNDEGPELLLSESFLTDVAKSYFLKIETRARIQLSQYSLSFDIGGFRVELKAACGFVAGPNEISHQLRHILQSFDRQRLFHPQFPFLSTYQYKPWHRCCFGRLKFPKTQLRSD